LIALDTNILVYAHRRDSEFNERAYERVTELARGRGAWAIPWPCIYEFFAVVTHPRIYDPPSSTDQAIEQIDAWLEAPGVVLLTETEVHWAELRGVIAAARVAGPRVHDARIAALCLAHGVRELWTADRDFSRFPALPTHNPLSA
jgi:uncharacterized protein